MAAKTPAAKKAAKTVKKSKSTSATAGMSAAQRGAYQKAAQAATKAAQTQHNATTLQERRLQGAAKARSKLAAKGAQLFSARIKTNAVSQTYRQIAQAHQSKGLRVQAAHNLFKAQSLATNRQFAYSGEAIHLHTTVMQTLTNAQALNVAQRQSASARKRILAGASKKKPKAATKAKARTSRSPYAAAANKAGLAAAAKIPSPSKTVKPKTKTQPAKVRKAPGVTRTVNPEWITAGNDEDKENCVLVAVANHCLLHTGHRISESFIDYMGMYNAQTIAQALGRVDVSEAWTPATLTEYGMVNPEDAKPGMLIGFEAENGPHCGVLMAGNMVVSYGEVVPLTAEIEEAWEATWTMTRP